MSENTALWDKLGKTDPKHTKPFKRGGGFSGTAIKPMWSYHRMTVEFGPCGIGWGVGEPSFQVVPGNEGEVLVYCTASIWYRETAQPTAEAVENGVVPFYGQPRVIYGVGGDKVVGKNKYGLSSDDEAFKKAFTDAITNALKMIGVGADVHMGLFDDSKYVNSVASEFKEADLPPQNEPELPQRRSSASLKRDDAWGKLMTDLTSDFMDCHSLASLAQLRATYREKAREAGWPRAWLEALANEFDTVEEAIKKVGEDA